MKSIPELLSDIDFFLPSYTSFDILFLDVQNKTNNSIPIVMTYRYKTFLELIEFMRKNSKRKLTNFSLEYLDDGIRFHARTSEDKFTYVDAKIPNTGILGFSLHDYRMSLATALARIFNIPYTPIAGLCGYSLRIIPYLSVGMAANAMAIDLDASTLDFPITITSQEDKISVFKQLGLPENIMKKSHINILGKNTFKDPDDLVSCMYMIIDE